MKIKATERHYQSVAILCIKSSPDELDQMRAPINSLVREHPVLHALTGLSFVPFSHPRPKLQA